MKPLTNIKKRNSTKLTEEELTQKLFTTVIAVVILVLLVVLSFTFFAPTVGSIFKIFSKNSNDEELIIKPSTPVIAQLPDSSKETKIKITGYSQEGMTIKLFVNGPEKAATITGTDGMFVFEDIDLIKGRNTIFAKAVDTEGNESDTTDTLIVTIDNDAPKIEVESPKDGDIVRNLDKRITVRGKVNEKSTITINDQIAIVRADLTFEHVLGVNEGKVEIKIKATDEAGNEKEETLSVTYQKKSN